MSIESNLTYEEYASRPGVTATMLKKVAKSSLKSVKHLIDGHSDQSDDMDLGTAFHALLLENKEEYVVQPQTYISTSVKKGEDPIKKWTNQSKTCRAWAKEQTLPILTQNEVGDLLGMVQVVKQQKDLMPYLSGKTELSIFTNEKGRKLKAKIDLLPDDLNGPVIDFKKTRSSDPVKFTRQCFDLAYYIQAALYLDLLKLEGIHRKSFWLVGVEDRAPYNICICKMDDVPISFIEYGRIQYRDAYHKLMNAINNNDWPSYGSFQAEMYLTPFMMREIESVA